MIRNAALKLLWLPLFALGSFACPTFLGAQQTSSVAQIDLTPVAGATRSGLYPVYSSGPYSNSMHGLASPIGSKASIRAGSINSRSAWLAGADNLGRSGTVMWNTPQADFSGAGAASWNAGARSFGLDRQQRGIWREVPAAVVQPDFSSSAKSSGLSASSESTLHMESSDLFAPSKSTSNLESTDLFARSGLTSKGIAILKAARPSTLRSAHQSKTPWVRGSAAGRAGTPFSLHAPRSSSFGNGVGFTPTQQTPSSEGVLGSPFQESPNLNGNPPSSRAHISGVENGGGGSSH